MSIDAFKAVMRFGLGPKGNELDKIASDPRAWLLSQLESPKIPPEIAAFSTNKEAEKAQMAWLVRKSMEGGDKYPYIVDVYKKQSAIRFNVQVKTTQPFIERLTMFWSNHFTVSRRGIEHVTAYTNQYEGKAIRPHVNGYFADMLIAVCQHPAMLIYLNNHRSVGPNSLRGKRDGLGLNENLGREILELHTLGVNGGYTQNDVIALAKIITGWSVQQTDLTKDSFQFSDGIHEPGSKILLGKTYTENGLREGIQALKDLALHPSTARHLATKLVRHFFADDPPEKMIRYIADVYMKSGGNLKEVNKALVSMPDSLSLPLTKIRNPYEYMLAACRLTGMELSTSSFFENLNMLNYDVFQAGSPAGYPDTTAMLVSSDGTMKRIEWAKAFADKLPPDRGPRAFGNRAFGEAIHPNTEMMIREAPAPADAYAYVFSSPEFQRR